LRGVSGEQVEQGRGKSGVLDFGDGFGIATRKDIALQLWTVHQPVRCFANGLEPAQPVGERRRHLLALGPSGVAGSGSAGAISETPAMPPSRGNRQQFEADLPRRLDEHQILIGQRQNGYLGEIDLLLPRQRQQQVERPFIAFDVDNQCRLVRCKFGRPSGFE